MDKSWFTHSRQTEYEIIDILIIQNKIAYLVVNIYGYFYGNIWNRLCILSQRFKNLAVYKREASEFCCRFITFCNTFRNNAVFVATGIHEKVKGEGFVFIFCIETLFIRSHSYTTVSVLVYPINKLATVRKGNAVISDIFTAWNNVR